MEELSAELPGVRLLIAGDGPARDEVESLAARLGGAAVLAGHRDDVMAVLDAADDSKLQPSGSELTNRTRTIFKLGHKQCLGLAQLGSRLCFVQSQEFGGTEPRRAGRRQRGGRYVVCQCCRLSPKRKARLEESEVALALSKDSHRRGYAFRVVRVAGKKQHAACCCREPNRAAQATQRICTLALIQVGHRQHRRLLLLSEGRERS